MTCPRCGRDVAKPDRSATSATVQSPTLRLDSQDPAPSAERPERCATCGAELGLVDVEAGTGLCGWCETKAAS